MNDFVLLGALDAETIIKWAVIVLILFGSAIGKIIASMRGQQRPAGPQLPPAPPPRQPQIQPQMQAQVARPKSVKDEIDDFLRRAAQKKQSQTGSGGTPARSAFEPRQSPDAPTRRLSQPSVSLSQRQEPIKAEVVRERPVGGAISEQVNKYLDEKEFDQRASKLGGNVAAADSKIEQHLKEKFGHGISELASKTGVTAAPPTPKSTGFFEDDVPVMAAAGTGLAVLFNNIDNLRQAIVINEILQRPGDRWK
jgi:hypothetical protein